MSRAKSWQKRSAKRARRPARLFTIQYHLNNFNNYYHLLSSFVLCSCSTELFHLCPRLVSTVTWGLCWVWDGVKVRKSLREELLQGLNNISRAPLKPHQRMIMCKFLIPRFLHELALAPVGDGWLR